MDISIIIPVFNSEKYLLRCLDSIFNQQFSGTFEVIAVDDGSIDDSLKLLYNYQLNEKRLKIIVHEKNKKVSVARATGIKASVGDYIMHIDSDDWILPETLARSHAKIVETKADIVVFNNLKADSKGMLPIPKKIKKEFILKDKAKVEHHFFEFLTNKIAKRILSENMITGQVSVNSRDDLLYLAEILLRADKICFIPESYYVYFVNDDSITHTVNPSRYAENNIIVLRQLQRIITANNSSSSLNRNLLDFFEKYIYLDLAKNHFWYKSSKPSYFLLAKEFSNTPIIGSFRISRLKLSIQSGFICLLEVAFRFKLRQVRQLLLVSFKNIEHNIQ